MSDESTPVSTLPESDSSNVTTTASSSPCGSDYIFVEEEGVYFKNVTDELVSYKEARAKCLNEGRYFFFPNANISGEETAQNLLNAGVLSSDVLGAESNFTGLWTTALFRTRHNIFWNYFDKVEVEIPTAVIENVENGTNYGVILKWNNESDQFAYTTFDMSEKALYTCVCDPSLPAQQPPPPSPECESGDIYVGKENLCFTKAPNQLVTYVEARDMCHMKGEKYFIPNPEIPGGKTAISLLEAGVLPSYKRGVVGRNYLGIWTTALFNSSLNIFWHPFEETEIEIPTAFIGKEVQNGTDYGIILKWNRFFKNRKYRTFDMNRKALYTCAYPPISR